MSSSTEKLGCRRPRPLLLAPVQGTGLCVVVACARCAYFTDTGTCACKRRRRTGHVTRIGSWPTDRAMTFHLYTSHTLTRLVKGALDSGRFNHMLGLRCLAAWLLRQRISGSDYTYGALGNIRSLMGREMTQAVEALAAMAHDDEERIHVTSLCNAWSEMDDGRSSMSVAVFSKGHWRLLCNNRFDAMFATSDEIERSAEQQRILPSFLFRSFVSADDYDEFVELLASTFFYQGTGLQGENGSVLKCVDRHGSSFLAMVRMKLVCVGAGDNMGLRISVLPLPTSPYLHHQHADMHAPVLLSDTHRRN